jgi:hypothetical protein
MDSNKEHPTSSSCGPDCSCNTKSGMPLQIKIILFIVIIAVAGAVLSSSLIKKTRTKTTAKASTEYAVTASQLPASSAMTKKDTSVSSVADTQTVSFKHLASLSDLNTVAQDVEGVFILLIKNDAEKTPGMLKEISAAKKAIASHGMHMGAFQLNKEAPDYTTITSQMPAPGVLVVVKGKGMRGVQGSDITETKLLQAYMAAMQPTSCCPAGSKRVCK